MNITRQTLSNWEVGINYPDIDAIVTLGRIYNISLDELLFGKIYFKGALSMKRKLTEEQIAKLIKRNFAKS